MAIANNLMFNVIINQNLLETRTEIVNALVETNMVICRFRLPCGHQGAQTRPSTQNCGFSGVEQYVYGWVWTCSRF